MIFCLSNRNSTLNYQFCATATRTGDESKPNNLQSASSRVRSVLDPKNLDESSRSLICILTLAPLTYSSPRVVGLVHTQ